MLAFIIISWTFALMSFIPVFRIAHWTFRIFDYVRLQLIFIQLIILITGFFLYEKGNAAMMLSQVVLGISILYQTIIIFPYLPTHHLFKKIKKQEKTISVISVNVLQKNEDYYKLIELVKNIQPDILLTMETNKKWEKAIEEFEQNYAFNYKIPKENRYGMHFYTNLKVNKAKEHYFVSDERPAIEVHLLDKDNNDFVFWGIHPPPPSPTEKPTSKQKDAELMKIAKLVRELKSPSIVTGDFNNVCWSRSAKLFAKISDLKDARLGKGIHGTFPVKPSILRFPIDLLFSSKEIEVHEIKALSDIGSDHLPFFSKFTIVNAGFHEVDKLESGLKEKANLIIKEGKEAVKTEE